MGDGRGHLCLRHSGSIPTGMEPELRRGGVTPTHYRIGRHAYHRTVLSNGLRIVSAPRHEAESVTVGVWINAGGRHENLRLNGISHFLEHLLFKGTARFSSRMIKEAIEGRGGALNAFTDEEFTCVWAKVQPKDLKTTVQVLTEMVLYSKLDLKEMEKERAVILEEIRMYRDLPMQSVHDLLNGLLWPKHPLGMILSGTENSVRRIRKGDLVSYQRRHYTPVNIVIAACGRLSHRALVEAVSDLWKKIPPGNPQRPRRVVQNQRSPRLKVEVKETEQTHLCLGFHAFPRNHPHAHALNLLNVILGGNMSSRLFQRVREDRGLAYEIGSQVRRFRDTGLFSIAAGVEHRHLARCLEVILKELSRVCKEPVRPKEFEQALEFFIGQLLFSLEDTSEHMSWIGECEMILGRVQPVEAVLAQVQRVKREYLTQVARAILRSNHLSLAVIGPVAKKVSGGLPKLLEL
ncbi:MAG: insulinase family protein [Candidatus Omnitrophica bacterium]|nr:insulinase family protein [Candidatus Omnitrophota bacterium]